MRIEMLCRVEIRSKKIFKELWDDVDEDLIGESFGGRSERKTKKPRKNKEKQGDGLIAGDIAQKSERSQPAVFSPEPSVLPKTVEGNETKQTERSEGEKPKVSETVKYFADNLVSDLRIIYPEISAPIVQAEAWKKAKQNLKMHGVRWLTKPSEKAGAEGKSVRRFSDGRKLIGEIIGYLESKTGEPESWKEEKSLLSESRISLELLREARKTKEKASDPVATQKEAPVESMKFEDKVKMMNEAGYGGTLFADYKRYVEGGDIPENLENVITQVGKLFPFDVKIFAEEVRAKMEGAKKPVSEWEEKYKNDEMFNALKQGVDEGVWEKKVSEWSEMDERSRDNSLLIYRALMKIKGSGEVTPESQRLWDSYKNKLEELGLML